MRSWQRALALGASLLLAGAAATFVYGVETHGARQTLTDVLGVLLVGVGGSLLATGLVARLVSNQVFGIDVTAALEALRGTSYLARANQTLTITLEVDDGDVLATGKHEFDVLLSSRLAQLEWLSLYTDVGSDGGFVSVKEPDGHVLAGIDLTKDHVAKVEGNKSRFSKKYLFQHDKPARFVVQTFGRFRLSDRLIWTVEHISKDFTVHIVDRRGTRSPACVKVNHHRQEAIDGSKRTHETPQGFELVVDYLGEVLPYQGFELQWEE
jgi:hypothetical protein